MERHQHSNSLLKTTLFGVAAFFLCGLMSIFVWFHFFYVYIPAIVEPILTFIVMVLSILGAYLIVAPKSASSPFIAAMTPVALYTAVSGWSDGRFHLSVIAAAVVAGLTVQYLRRQEVKSRRRQALTGVLLIVLCIVFIDVADRLFLVDLGY